MSQPDHAVAHDRSEPDPLLEFNAEPAADPPAPLPPVETPAPEPVERVDRLAKAERGLERAQVEIAALRSDLATLVGTIDDIRKRLRQRPEPPTPTIQRQRRRAGAAAAFVLIGIAGGAALWRSLATLAADLPVPPPIQVAGAVAAAPPAASIPAPVDPAPRLQPAAAVAPPRAAAPRAAYLGTLSIDADPGGEVFIDRKSAGRTPLRVENVRAGSHLIWIERDGFRRWTRVVQVPAYRVTRVSASLERP